MPRAIREICGHGRLAAGTNDWHDAGQENLLSFALAGTEVAVRCDNSKLDAVRSLISSHNHATHPKAPVYKHGRPLADTRPHPQPDLFR